MITAQLAINPTASVRTLCRSAGVSRAAFYRWRARLAVAGKASTELRATLQRVCLEMPM